MVDRAARLRAPVDPRLRDQIWLKLVGNVAFNPISALTGATLEQMVRHPEVSQLVRQVMAETEAVAARLGMELPITIDQRIAGAAKVGEHKTSMLQDLEAGRPLELDALKADYAIVRAWKGDKWGNLVYRKTARNFNPMMATAAAITIAEVEHLVEVGDLEADLIHTPSIYVKRIFQGELYEKKIERRTVRKMS